MLGEHLFWINGNKGPFAARQDFALVVLDLSHIDMPASIHTLFMRCDGQGYAQRHGPQIPDLHGPGKRQHVAELVHLTHGFIQYSGDNSAVGVARRACKTARQLEMANGLACIFIEREPESHALRIVMAAAEAVVLAGFGLTVNCVAVGDFVFRHG